MKCPVGHGAMVPMESFVCPVCKLQAGTIEQTGKLQNAISEERDLKKPVGLLPTPKLEKLRAAMGYILESSEKKHLAKYGMSMIGLEYDIDDLSDSNMDCIDESMKEFMNTENNKFAEELKRR